MMPLQSQSLRQADLSARELRWLTRFFSDIRQRRAIQYIGDDKTGLHFDSDHDAAWTHTLMLQGGGSFRVWETGDAGASYCAPVGLQILVAERSALVQSGGYKHQRLGGGSGGAAACSFVARGTLNNEFFEKSLEEVVVLAGEVLEAQAFLQAMEDDLSISNGNANGVASSGPSVLCLAASDLSKVPDPDHSTSGSRSGPTGPQANPHGPTGPQANPSGPRGKQSNPGVRGPYH